MRLQMLNCIHLIGTPKRFRIVDRVRADATTYYRSCHLMRVAINQYITCAHTQLFEDLLPEWQGPA